MAKIRAILPSSTTRLMSDGPPASSSIRMPRPPLSQSRAIFGLSAASGKEGQQQICHILRTVHRHPNRLGDTAQPTKGHSKWGDDIVKSGAVTPFAT